MGGPVGIETAIKIQDKVRGTIIVDIVKDIEKKYSLDTIDEHFALTVSFINSPKPEALAGG